MKTEKTPADSQVTMTQIVLPSHANALGTIFGGVVASWIDIAAAIAAQRHARTTVVTASIDALHFLAPIRVGQIAEVQAMINFVSRTSMEIGVRVNSEDPRTGERHHNCSAYVTMVALDAQSRPTAVPPLALKTPEEKRRNEEARKRREARMRLAQEIKEARSDL